MSASILENASRFFHINISFQQLLMSNTSLNIPKV